MVDAAQVYIVLSWTRRVDLLRNTDLSRLLVILLTYNRHHAIIGQHLLVSLSQELFFHELGVGNLRVCVDTTLLSDSS